jgi:hypothetical protein
MIALLWIFGVWSRWLVSCGIVIALWRFVLDPLLARW